MSLVKRNRKLLDESEVFSQNAWDDLVWTPDMLDSAKARVKEQMDEAKAHTVESDRIESEVPNMWDQFYQAHGDKFFKDRRWILSEFPEIIEPLQNSQDRLQIFEVGCGVGNAVVQFVDTNKNPNLHIYCCDLSTNAIETLKTRDFYLNSKNHIQIDAFQADICTEFDTIVRSRIEASTLDYITLIFTLSALKPENMRTVINNLASLLKPGGIIFFRDYAQYDLTQLRFKGKSYIKENYYVRADGTTSYFFSKELVAQLFENANLTEVELKVDNRLLVNRLKSLKMCRCWIQAKYEKPCDKLKD